MFMSMIKELSGAKMADEIIMLNIKQMMNIKGAIYSFLWRIKKGFQS